MLIKQCHLEALNKLERIIEVIEEIKMVERELDELMGKEET